MKGERKGVRVGTSNRYENRATEKRIRGGGSEKERERE